MSGSSVTIHVVSLILHINWGSRWWSETLPYYDGNGGFVFNSSIEHDNTYMIVTMIMKKYIV